MRTGTSVRIDEETKIIASEVLKQYGMSLSEGINLFCKQVAMTYSIPFELKVPTKRMKKPTPKSPKTIEGTPARLFTAARITLKKIPLPANSVI